MSFTLRDIRGAVVEIKHLDPEECMDYCQCSAHRRAYEKQASVPLRFNRERLAKAIYCQKRYVEEWESTYLSAMINDAKDDAYAIADAIIAAEKNIIEVDQ